MTKKVNWLAPTSTAAGFFGGISLAFCHHLYYTSLVGASVEGDRSVAGYRFSNQQFNSAIGTAFSFAVRALLMFSISTAYIQIVWQAVKHIHSVNKLEEIDALFSAFSNILALRMVSVWKKYPLLLMIVLFWWLFPIAFVVPPATLFLMVTAKNLTSLQYVPNFDFTSLRYVADMQYFSDGPSLYNGPNEEVQGVTAAAAARGSILPITPPAANSSWELEFYGPSIRCSQVEDWLKIEFEQDIATWLWNRTDPASDEPNCEKPQGYIAWEYNSEPHWVPGPYEGNHFDNSPDYSLSSGFYIALVPRLLDTKNSSEACARSVDTSPSQPLANFNSTFLRCQLHNASYHTEFRYQSGTQSIAVDVEPLESLNTTWGVFGPSESAPYCLQLPPAGDTCVFEASAAQGLSYTAILDAFRRLVIGSIATDGSQLTTSTSIMSTALSKTPDLNFVYSDRCNGCETSESLQLVFQHVNASSGYVLSDTHETGINQSLQDAMEQMFHNITISLLSSQLLQPNLTSKFAPPKVNVSTTVYVVEYNYSARQLWVAYGIAVAVSIMVISVGLFAIRSNGASYTNDFSSIYRVAHQAVLGVAMQPKDTDGAYPLAKYLAKAHLSLAGMNPSQEDGRQGYLSVGKGYSSPNVHCEMAEEL